MSEILKQYFTERYDVSDDDIAEVIKYFNPIEVAKDEILLTSGDICRYFFFVEKGAVRTFFINEKGQESTRFIAFDGDFISSSHSFIRQTPSNEFISAIENSKLLRISSNDFKSGSRKIPLLKDWYIKILEKAYLTQHWRIETLMSLGAKERYKHLITHEKKLVQRLSNKLLASFMGITQESLSRIKAEK